MNNFYCLTPFRTLFPKPVRKELASELLLSASIEPNTRPFQLTVSEFGRICEAYVSICEKKPDYIKYNYREKKSEDYWPDIDIIHSDSDNITSLKN